MAILVSRTTCGRGTRRADFATPWRSMPWMLVQLVESGAYRLDLPAASHHLPSGTLWIIPPNCRHRQRVVGTAPIMTTHMHLIVRRADGSDLAAGLGAPRILPRMLGSPLAVALRAAVDAAQATRDTATELVAQAALHALAAEVVRALGSDLAGTTADPALSAAFAWAEASLHLPIAHRDLAARAGLSPSRFHARCLAATGLPPLGWVRRRRLERAAELVVGSDLGMAAIALRCGFCDPFHLNKRFRAAYGVPPTEFRRRERL